MKQVILTVLAIFISANVLANTQSLSLNKNTNSLQSLGSVFKSPQSIPAKKIDPSDIMMGYAGQDITDKPVVA